MKKNFHSQIPLTPKKKLYIFWGIWVSQMRIQRNITMTSLLPFTFLPLSILLATNIYIYIYIIHKWWHYGVFHTKFFYLKAEKCNTGTSRHAYWWNYTKMGNYFMQDNSLDLDVIYLVPQLNSKHIIVLK